MRAIDMPGDNAQDVYQTCVDSIADDDFRERLRLIVRDIDASAADYFQKAQAKKLFQIPAVVLNNDDIVVGAVTKKELKSVYSQQMVERKKPGRNIYDHLLSRAPLGRCPFCGVGYASTLDHYLPKSKFPCLAVLPINLVPSCKDCNTGKSTAIATTAGEQCLHPYFDQQHFIIEQWLFAKVLQTKPVSIQFYVEPPEHWDEISKERVKSHFEDFKLAARFSLEASNQLANIRDTLFQYEKILGEVGIQQHLNIEATSYEMQHINSWQTAMYQTLAASEWYVNGGYK